MPPVRFGRYTTIAPLGSGAMGSVYRARDEVLGREVAVKTLRLVGFEGLAGEMFEKRFQNEARAVASITHPNVVHVFDLGVEDGTPFLVMEVVEGESLKAKLERGTLPPAAVRGLGVQIARALDAAHARGVLHRDVKPANLLEAANGVWKLADFGVAHVPDSSLTITGQFLGSPAYAAPEAIGRGEFSPASDVYGLGATLYHALTGKPPNGERTAIASRMARRIEPGELGADVPADLAAALARALAPDPKARPSAAELADLLATSATAILAPATRTPPSRRAWLLPTGIAAGALVIGLAVGMTAARTDTPAPAPVVAPAPAVAPTPPPDDEEREKRWAKVRKRLDKGQYEQAMRDLEELLEADPTDEAAADLYERLREAHGVVED